ncbi:HD domain-containing phosphohydrolase [Rhizobium sp. C4]|uniref:HD domain-containing phosphohydrolase n=1 Tax=Rhizobium sp. C4 TaxID=1349800 RepID=UPI001E37571E|nr:HD domain-containing phosphohydrolase [Rhizobium sp. C4]MCD2174480.1 response regulator [Rhizobium sp. C4]
MKILIVDDNNTNLRLLTGMVQKLRDCSPIPFSSPADALAAMPDLEFDVALIDYMMPVYNGVEFLTEMLHFEKYSGVPVIFITADHEMTTRMDALNAGAIDFLTKPVDFYEFKARVQNIAALAEAQRRHAESLSGGQMQGSDALRDQECEIIQRITLAAGYKDPQAAQQRMRVAAYSEVIARAAGLPEAFCRDIRLAAALFDNATALASDTSLLKRGKMTEADFRRRTNAGDADAASSSLLQLAAEIGRTYRERFDGQGYPNRLKGTAIPEAGRIVAIASSFDALISERQFKQAWPFEKAADYVRGKARSHFDPALIAAFEAALEDIRAIAFAETVPMGIAAA